MSTCRIISRTGDRVTVEIEINDGNGLRAVSYGFFTAMQDCGATVIRSGTLTIGAPVIYSDRKRIGEEMETAIDSMLCRRDFELPGEFEQVEAIETPTQPKG